MKSTLFLQLLSLVAAPFLLLTLSACSEESASFKAFSSEQVEGLWRLQSVDGHALNENDMALLFVLSRSLQADGSEDCSGATLAELDGEELFLVENSGNNCFVEFPANASAQLAVHDAVYSGVKVSYSANKKQLILSNLRNELIFTRK